MKPKITLILLALSAMLGSNGEAQTYDTNNVVAQTFAGSGFYGYLDGEGTQTMFNSPSRVVTDSVGNLLVLDTLNFRIRRIAPDGAVSTFAGGGSSATGYGTNASLVYSLGPMAIDHSGALWIVVPGYLLRIGSDAYVSSTGVIGLSGLSTSGGVCVDSGNNVYVADFYGERIYRYRTNGVLEVFAGSGNSGSADGNGIFTSFSGPSALAADAADNVYVWDTYNHLIRRINQNRDVETISGRIGVTSQSDGIGTNATFSSVSAMCADASGNLILACGSSIRRISATTNVTTLAGSFDQVGYANGAAPLARFRNAAGICLSQGLVFIADSADHRIRNLTFDPVSQAVSAANLALNTYPGLRITGTVGRTYQVLSSPDMTNWTTQATLLLNSSPYLWIDDNPVTGS